MIEVDVAGSGHALERCAADCAHSGPGVECDQDEARYVLTRPPIGLLTLLNLPIAPCRPYQASRLRSGQPSVARRGFIRQDDRHDLVVEVLAPMID